MSASIDQVPTIALRDDGQIPQLGFGVFQIPPADTAEATTARSRPATATSTRRPPTATRPRSARPSTPPDSTAATSSSRPSASTTTTATSRPSTPARQSLDRLETRLRRPLPDPLAGAVAGQVRRHLEGVRRAAAGGPRALDRRVELPARAPAPDHRGDRRDAVGQPDRAAPALPAGRAAPRARGPRHRDRGLEPARPGRRARRSRDHRDRRGPRQDAGPGRAALARPARQRRVPQVGHARAHRGELRPLRLPPHRRGDGRRSRRSTRGDRIGPDPDTFVRP